MENSTVSFAAYESAVNQAEKANKRAFRIALIAIIYAFLSTAIWLYAWLQYDYVSEESTVTYTQDGRGFNNINTGFQGDLDLIGDEDK